MAKEEDLKRVELKVSVNCCEGCKRKVVKALSIKGVLRTEIHPTLPKVTVIGNVDVQVLLKKLAKAGKSAEIILLEEAQKPPQEGEKCCAGEAPEKKSTKSNEKGKDQESEKSAPENEKSPNSADATIGTGNGDHARGKELRDKEATTSAPPATIVTAIPLLASQARVFYPMEPVAVPVQYYAMNAYPHPSPHYVVQEHYYYEATAAAAAPPPVQSQPTAFGDYFNDDNTVGCRIM